MGTPKSLSLFTLFLALAVAPQSAVALRFDPFAPQIATVEPVFSLPDSVESGTKIKIGSSSTLAGVNEVLEQRFENQFSGTQVELDYSSSDEALAALDAGTIDIAAIGRPLSDAEKAQGYTEVLLGRHKIAIIVSEENPFADDVTTVQFAQLFRGEITDWSELEGEVSGAIRFVDRPEVNDTRQALSGYPVFKEAAFDSGTTADPVDDESTAALVNALGTDGIGFAIADQVINRPGVRVLSMHKVLPTNPAYPFSQPMAYVYKGDASPSVQAFLGYVTAPGTAEVLDEAKSLGAEATFEGLQGAPNLDSTALAGLVGTPSGTDTSGTDASGTSNAETDPASETANDTSASSDGSADEGTTGAGAETEAETAGAPDSDSANTTAEGATGEGATTANEDGATVDGAVVDGATADGATADSPNSTGANAGEDTAAASKGKMPWWLLWLLGIPVLGLLLWWLLSRRTDDGDEVSPIAGVDPSTIAGAGAAGTAAAAAAAGGVVAAGSQQDQMALVPRDAQSAYAYWEVSEDSLAHLREEGGEEFGLRLYDVTSWDEESELPKPLHQETFDETECDRHVSIPTPDREYLAEVGYVTPADQWLSAVRSAPVHVSSDLPPFSSVTAPTVDQHHSLDGAVEARTTVPKPPADSLKDGLSQAENRIKGAAIAGTAAAAAGLATVAGREMSGSQAKSEAQAKASPTTEQGTGVNRVILVPRDGQQAYAYWEISEQKKTALQQQGGEKLLLRLYDVTGIDPRTQKPHSVQQFDCNEQENDLHITVPAPDRTYLADLGYTTAEGKWLRLAHAAPVQVPAQDTAHRDKGNGSGLTVGGIVDGITERAGDAVQSSKEAVGTGQSAIGTMAKSVLNTGSKAGQSLVDGATQAGQSLTAKKPVAAVATGVAAAATGVAATMKSPISTAKKTRQAVQIVLVARNAESAYAYWEIPDGVESELASHNVERVSLRLHDVTNIDLDHSPAHSTQVFECPVTDRDRHLPIAVPNKDYLVELGYTPSDGTWVELARSLHVRVE